MSHSCYVPLASNITRKSQLNLREGHAIQVILEDRYEQKTMLSHKVQEDMGFPSKYMLGRFFFQLDMGMP